MIFRFDGAWMSFSRYVGSLGKAHRVEQKVTFRSLPKTTCVASALSAFLCPGYFGKTTAAARVAIHSGGC